MTEPPGVLSTVTCGAWLELKCVAGTPIWGLVAYPPQMTGDEAKHVLDLWDCRARRSQKAHYLLATKYTFRQGLITFGLIVISATTGSALLVTLSANNRAVNLSLAIVSIVSAALAGLDRAKRYLENAEKHRVAGANWTPVLQAIEQLAAQLPAHPPVNVQDQLTQISQQMDDVTKKSPQIPERVFQRLEIDQCYMHPLPKAGLWARLTQWY